MSFWSFLGSGLAGLASGIFGYNSAKDTNAANIQAVRETNDMNYKIAQETNQANKDMYQQQYQDQLEMWHMQNAYNDPSNEVSRLRAAGLNPSLTFGNAAQAGSMSVPSASPAVGATMQAPHYSDVVGTAFRDAINTALSVLSTYGSSSKDLAEAKGVEIDNQTRDQMNRVQIDQAMAEIKEHMSKVKVGSAEYDYLKELGNKVGQEATFLKDSHDISLENLRNQAMQSQASARALEAQAEKFASEKAFTDSLNALTKEQLKVEPQRLKAVIANTIADTKNKLAQANLAGEQAKTQESVRGVNQSVVNLNQQAFHESIARQYKLSLESSGIKNANQVYEATKDYVIQEAEFALKSAELTVRQQGSDYWNPFRYAGQTFGGAAAAAIKMAK